MNKRKKTTPEIINYLHNKNIPEMWNPGYSKCYVQINKDLLVNLGGQGYMNEQSKLLSEIEEYWGGVIDDIGFVVSLYKCDKEISDNHYIRNLHIVEFRVDTDIVDEWWFTKRFSELILDYGLYPENRELDNCFIENKPKFKYVRNL